MKKLPVLVLLMSFLFSFSYSQTAESVLDKSAQKVKTAKGIGASFSLTQKDAQNRVVSNAKGIMKLKGNKYFISQQGTEIYSDGNKIWNYDGQNEVTVAKVDSDDESFSPQQILTGFNKKDFIIKMISTAGANYQVQLVPVDKRQNFKQIVLYINKTTSLVSKAIVTEKANGTTEINFSNIALNASYSDNQFVFDATKHPGVEVINN